MMGKRIVFAAAIISYAVVFAGCSRLETKREMKTVFLKALRDISR